MAEEEQDAAFLDETIEPPDESAMEWSGMYFRAFNAIRDDRQYAECTAGRISFVAIEAWARRYQIPDEDFDIFHALIREMDEEYIVWFGEEAKKAIDAAEAARNKPT